MISRDGANRWVGGRSLQFSVILLGKNPKGALVVDHRSCDFGPILEPHWPKWPWTNQGRMFLMRRRLHAGPNISTWAEQRPSTDQLQFTHIPDSSDKSLKFRTPFNKKKTKTYTSKFFSFFQRIENFGWILLWWSQRLFLRRFSSYKTQIFIVHIVFDF